MGSSQGTTIIQYSREVCHEPPVADGGADEKGMLP